MNHYTRDNFQVNKSIGFLLNRARNIVAMEQDRALKPLDISVQHMGILLLLAGGIANTPYELSTQLGMDTGLMTRTLDKLEQKELLTRRHSTQDRRVVNIEMTPKGEDFADRIPDLIVEVLNQRLQRFSKGEFEEFLRLLKKLAE